VICDMDNKILIKRYMQRLIPKIFKLMPLKENKDENYNIYLSKLIIQIMGFKDITIYVNETPSLIDIIANLSGLKNECDIRIHNSIVKECINICQRSIDRMGGDG
jgi:hypothetical protein